MSCRSLRRQVGFILLTAGLAACGPAAAPPDSPTPATSPTAADGTLACKLPVVRFDQATIQQAATAPAILIDFPSGDLTTDPRSTFTEADGILRSMVEPYLSAPYAGIRRHYDREQARWLPVTKEAVSPDGSRYAYVAGALHEQIHIVEVATGIERVVSSTSPTFLGLIRYGAGGIYLVLEFEGRSPGLFLFNPSTGAIRKLFAEGVVEAVEGSAAWLEDINTSDPHPPVAAGRPGDRGYPGQPQPNQIVRRDLDSGASQPWFYRPGQTVYVIAFDQDSHPLVQVFPGDGTLEIWLASAPGSAQKLYAGQIGQAPGTPMADRHGIWFGGTNGIFLYTARAGLKKLSSVSGFVAGACS